MPLYSPQTHSFVYEYCSYPNYFKFWLTLYSLSREDFNSLMLCFPSSDGKMGKFNYLLTGLGGSQFTCLSWWFTPCSLKNSCHSAWKYLMRVTYSHHPHQPSFI